MRDFTKVSPKIWRSKAFKALPADEVRLLMLYLMTSEHQNSAGCFRLPEGYALDDLGWPSDKYRSCLAALTDAGLVISDPNTLELFVRGWFETNSAMNKKHALGVERAILGIESEMLREAATQEFEMTRKDFDKQGTEPADSNVLGMPNRLTATGYMTRRQG